MKFLALTFLLILTFPAIAFANNPISVTVDGEPVIFHDQGPAIVDNRTLVPVRGVFEAIGFEVSWNDATRTATLTSDGYVVVLNIGSANFTTNGVINTLDVPAQIIASRTMLPIRAVLESVGFYVDWHEASRTVIVSSSPLTDAALVWRVEPTLEYVSVRLCSCGLFFEGSDWDSIDPVTGLHSGIMHPGHGGPAPEWVYDPVRDLFGHPSYGEGYHSNIGMFPLAEFDSSVRGLSITHRDWLLSTTDGLLVVQSVDSSLRTTENAWEGEENWWNLTTEAFSGRFALMYDRAFVTDFVFDGGQPWWHSFTFDGGGVERNLNYIPMSRNGYWGMLDRNGNTVLPFIFENFVRIDENTAFARLDGRYGILDLRATMNHP